MGQGSSVGETEARMKPWKDQNGIGDVKSWRVEVSKQVCKTLEVAERENRTGRSKLTALQQVNRVTLQPDFSELQVQ